MSCVGKELVKFGQCSPAQKTLLREYFKVLFELYGEYEDLLEHAKILKYNIEEHYKTDMEQLKKDEESKYKCNVITTLSNFTELSSGKFGTVVSDKDNTCMGNSRNVLNNHILKILELEKDFNILTVSERIDKLNLNGITNIYIVEQLLAYFEDIGISKDTIWNLKLVSSIKTINSRIEIIEHDLNILKNRDAVDLC